MNLKLRELRTEEGITQKELARLVDTTDKSIWAYENGKAFPPPDMLIKFAKFFDISVDELLGLDEQGQGAAAGFAMTKRAELTPEEDELLYYFRALSPYLKQNLLTAAQTMATGSGVKPLHKKA